MTEEHILRESIVKQAPSATNDRFSFARHVIGEGDARGKVVVVLAVELVGLDIVSGTTVRRRIEGVEHVRLFTSHTEVVPTNAIVKSQLGRDAK